jgi:hypothetical protein
MAHMRLPALATTVIGAGPAGLLFCAIGRMLRARRVGDPAAWSLRLFDKRDAYVRTHRLRIDPAPFAAIGADLADPRFDALVTFLQAEDWTPEVSRLEARLLALVEDLGVKRELRAVGDGPGELTLPGLRASLEREGFLAPETRWTIVAADSVHSVVREAVRGRVAPVRRTHEHVARLRVSGKHLPERLGLADQYRLSKVLGSVLDYRINRNGYAEVDLFLDPAEHRALGALGATPAAPVPLRGRDLARLRAPLLRRLVELLEAGLGRGPWVVLLQSTFHLEHSVMPRVVFSPPGLHADVFLLGDAALSLPFFRGLACLAQCAHSLARVHMDLAYGERERHVRPERRYDREVAEIARRELTVVAARAKLVGGLREFVRLSALLPFPLQSWWLSVRDAAAAADHVSFGLVLNLALAGTAFGLVVAGALSGGGTAWLAMAVQFVGGLAYHLALNLERGPHRWVRRVWEVQIALFFCCGVLLTGLASWSAGRMTGGLHALWWVIMAIPFGAGLLLIDLLGAALERRARLDR